MQQMALDRVEKMIIELLQADGRVSFVYMAENIGVTEGTIRRKYNRLVSEGIVRIVGIADPRTVGFSSLTIIGLAVAPGMVETVAQEVSELDAVYYVATTTGNLDIMIRAYFPDNSCLSRFITKQLSRIEGITEINTALVLDVYKETFDWGVAF